MAASSTISWSGKCVLILRLSPGSRIRFVLMDIRECCGLMSGCVVVLCACVCVCGFCVSSLLNISRDRQLGHVCCVCCVSMLPNVVRYRQLGSMWLCVVETGNRASLCVLGTVHLLPSNVIWLLTKSCLILLSLINVVPPITGQWRCCATIALNLSLCSFL